MADAQDPHVPVQHREDAGGDELGGHHEAGSPWLGGDPASQATASDERQEQEEHGHDEDVPDRLEAEGGGAVQRIAALGGVAEQLAEQREGASDEKSADQ